MSIHASGEDYLEAILVLQQQNGEVRSIDLARHFEFSKPSVSHAVSVLKSGGFLEMDPQGLLSLTDLGKELAEQIYERHCFFKKLLLSAGVDPVTAAGDACKMEHTITRESYEKLKVFLDDTLFSRYQGVGVTSDYEKHTAKIADLRQAKKSAAIEKRGIDRMGTT